MNLKLRIVFFLLLVVGVFIIFFPSLTNETKYALTSEQNVVNVLAITPTPTPTLTPTLTPTPTPIKPLNDYTWAEISAISQIISANNLTSQEVYDQYGWSVGDAKSDVINGKTYYFRIIGVNHDAKSDGSGTAGLTFDLASVIDTSYMNSTGTNVGGWTSSYIRSTIMPKYLALLPSDLQAVIVPVNKLTSMGNAKATITTTSDKLFLLSEVEVTGIETSYIFTGEGTQYEWYAAHSQADYIKLNANGVPATWYVRTPVNGNAANFHYIDTTGAATGCKANVVNGISFAFCL